MLAKGRRSLAVIALSVLGALLLALPAGGVSPAGGASGGDDPLAPLRAQLTGEKEVPGPGDTNGSGTAVVKVFRAKVCYTLRVRGIQDPTAAHIHLGLRDEAGPVVQDLGEPTNSLTKDCVETTRALSLELREHPRRYYVNVHNEPFPDGAIRGQLHR